MISWNIMLRKKWKHLTMLVFLIINFNLGNRLIYDVKYTLIICIAGANHYRIGSYLTFTEAKATCTWSVLMTSNQNNEVKTMCWWKKEIVLYLAMFTIFSATMKIYRIEMSNSTVHYDVHKETHQQLVWTNLIDF